MVGRALCALEAGCGDQPRLMSWFSPDGVSKFSPGGAPKAFTAAGLNGFWPNDVANGSLPAAVVRPVGSGEEVNVPATGPRIPPSPLDSAARAARWAPNSPPVETSGAGKLTGAVRSLSPGVHGGGW